VQHPLVFEVNQGLTVWLLKNPQDVGLLLSLSLKAVNASQHECHISATQNSASRKLVSLRQMVQPPRPTSRLKTIKS
jgi:hypothetical protein